MGKRGDELRALINQFPPPDGVKQILNELERESDRGVALISAALLEGILERLIIKALKFKTDDLCKQLVVVGGPLRDFHSKTIIALGFGIINENVASELRIIRSVKNVFAHAITSLSFETLEISREISRSAVVAIIQDGSPISLPVERMRVDFVKLITIMTVLLNLERAAERPASVSTLLGGIK